MGNIINRVKAAQGLKFPPNQEVTMNADGSGGPVSINKQTDWKSWGHGALDVLGMVPAFGNIADGINAAWYLAEGNPKMAAVAGASAIPGLGLFSGGAKLSMKAADAMNDINKARKVAKHTDPSAVKIASKLYSSGGKKIVNALPEVVKDNIRQVPKNLKKNFREGSKFKPWGNRPVKLTTADKVLEYGNAGYNAGDFVYGVYKGATGQTEPIEPGSYKKQRYMGGVASSNRQSLKSYKQ